MARLKIPQGAQESLVLLAKLSEQSMKSLKERLKNSSPAVPAADLAKTISPDVELESEQVKNLIMVLGSLFSIRVERELSDELARLHPSDAGESAASTAGVALGNRMLSRGARELLADG